MQLPPEQRFWTLFLKSQARRSAVSLAVTNLPSASATSTSMKQSAASRIVGSDSHARGRASVLRPPWSRRRQSALLVRRRRLRGRRRPKAAAAHPQLSPSPDRPAPPSGSRSPRRRRCRRAWPVMSAAIGDRRFVVAADQHAAGWPKRSRTEFAAVAKMAESTYVSAPRPPAGEPKLSAIRTR